jgi:hypothetical protein
LKKEFLRIKNDFEYKNKEDIYKSMNNNKGDVGQDLTANLIQKGEETNRKIDDALINMLQIAHEGNTVADEINKNLSEQIEQLDRIN